MDEEVLGNVLYRQGKDSVVAEGRHPLGDGRVTGDHEYYACK